jgi:hypothetical protein
MVTVYGCALSDLNWNGISSSRTSSNIKIQKNHISRIGNMAFGRIKAFIGIDCNSNYAEVSNNTLRNIGYTGILSAGLNNLIKRNIVDSTCLLLEDNGGIYTNGNINSTNGTVIEENIVTNSIGNINGIPTKEVWANGIYLDVNSQGVTVRNNTIAYISGSGLFFNYTSGNNSIYENTVYQCGMSELLIAGHPKAPHLKIKNNILVANSKSNDHVVFRSDKTSSFSLDQIGDISDNYIINPLKKAVVSIKYRNAGALKKLNVKDWNRTMKKTVNNYEKFSDEMNESRKTVNFYVNKTGSAKKYNLPSGSFYDVVNKVYTGAVTVAPYRSLILFEK